MLTENQGSGVRGQGSGEVYEALLRVSQLFNSILDPDLLLEQVMDEALKSVNAERGLLVLTDEKTGALEVKVARGIDQAIEKEREPQINTDKHGPAGNPESVLIGVHPWSISRSRVLSEASQSALKEVLSRREGKIYLDARSAFPAAQSIIIGQVRSIACVPLVCKGRLVGAIYVDSRTDKNVFHDDALRFLEAFAGIAALAIENARLYQTLASESSQLRAAMREWRQFPEIIGRSPAMQAVYELMNRVIPSDAPVLILGETGTGKELVARAIHYSGPRRAQPFVAVNCSAIPENLLESELFGYRKGAFTGAVTDKRGLLETANGGTVFLDEISDLPLPLQPKLLRVLQSGEVRWVGDTRDFTVDVRIISATNQSLSELVKARKFREDLYYRLNVVPVELPPLRSRREDIPLLVSHFLKQTAERQAKPIAGIEPAALNRLLRHSWPGNIRELENVIERATVLSVGPKVTEQDIMLTPAESDDLKAEGSVAEIEKRVVLERLKQFSGNRTRAALSLGISRRTLLNKLAEWKQEEEQK